MLTLNELRSMNRYAVFHWVLRYDSKKDWSNEDTLNKSKQSISVNESPLNFNQGYLQLIGTRSLKEMENDFSKNLNMTSDQEGPPSQSNLIVEFS